MAIIVQKLSKPNFKNAYLMLLAEEENIPMVMKGMEIGINDYFIYPGEYCAENEDLNWIFLFAITTGVGLNHDAFIFILLNFTI